METSLFGPRAEAPEADTDSGPSHTDSLADRLHRQGRLSDEDVLAAARIVLPLLDHASTEGIPHSELRIERVLALCPGAPGYTLAHFTADAHPLTGAPLARYIVERTSSDTVRHSHATQGNALPLLAPEYVLTRTLTPSSEVWAAGALLWWLLAGRPPYSLEQWIGLALERIAPPLPAWPTAAPHAGFWWAEPLACALAPDPAQRPKSPARLLEMCAAAAGEPAYAPIAYVDAPPGRIELPTPTPKDTMTTYHQPGIGDMIAAATYDADGLYRHLPPAEAMRIVTEATGCDSTWEAVADSLASHGFGVVPDPAAGDGAPDMARGECVIYAVGPTTARTSEGRDQHAELYVRMMCAIAQADGRTTLEEFTMLDRLVRTNTTMTHPQLLRAGALARWLTGTAADFDGLLMQLDALDASLAHRAAYAVARIAWADGVLSAVEEHMLRRLCLALDLPDDLATRPVGTLAA